MNDLLDANSLKISMRARKLWSVYRDNEDMIKIGAYQKVLQKKSMIPLNFEKILLVFYLKILMNHQI